MFESINFKYFSVINIESSVIILNDCFNMAPFI